MLPRFNQTAKTYEILETKPIVLVISLSLFLAITLPFYGQATNNAEALQHYQYNIEKPLNLKLASQDRKFSEFSFKWLTRQESTLLMKSFQGKDKILIPLDTTLLRATDRTQASHAIIKDGNGDVYISDGLSTYKLKPTAIIVAYWISLLLGILGLIYIILSSIPMIFNKKIARHNAILLPFINILLLSLPIYLYTKQSFLNFGELTAASFLMAVISGFLPISVLFALFFTCRKNVKNKWQKWDCMALFMSLQLCLVLIYWDVLPVIFWR